jgi:hypothetical protein
MVDRRERSIAQQLGQLARINPVALIARFQQSVLAGIAHRNLGYIRLEQVVQPGGPGSFFQGDQQVSAQPVDKLQNGGGLGFQNGFHHHLAGGIHDRHRDRVFVDVHVDVLGTLHVRVLLSLRGKAKPTWPTPRTYPEKGALL